MPAKRADQPMDFERRLDRQAQRDARREIVDLEPAIRGLDFGAQHVGVARVGHPRPHAVGLEGERAAFLFVEQPRKDRRAVEPRHAQPVDAGIGVDEREQPPVADDAVVEQHQAVSAMAMAVRRMPAAQS